MSLRRKTIVLEQYSKCFEELLPTDPINVVGGAITIPYDYMTDILERIRVICNEYVFLHKAQILITCFDLDHAYVEFRVVREETDNEYNQRVEKANEAKRKREEKAKKQKEEKAKKKADEDRAERELYERLRAKFEKNP